MATDAKQILFVGGNPRSGTSALVRLLNAHKEMFIGPERFFRSFQDGSLSPDFFARAMFTDPTLGNRKNRMRAKEMSAEDLDQKRSQMEIRYDQAKIVGDKFPLIAETYPWIFDRFPEARLLYIVRNPVSVAESYFERLRNPSDKWHRDVDTAIEDWNTSVSKSLEEVEKGRPITVVSYELLYSGRENFETLFATLGLDPKNVNPEKIDAIESRSKELRNKVPPRNDLYRREIFLKANVLEYRKLVENHCVLTSKGRDPVAADA